VLEASLLTAQAPATPLRLLRPFERASVATTTASAVVATTAIATTIVVAREAIGWRTAEIARPTCGPGAVFSDVEPQFTATDLATVELLDRLCGVLLSSEPNEGKASGASAFAILGNVNINDLTDLTEELTKLLVRRGEVEVPYEYLT
jgi:hypothetical protein